MYLGNSFLETGSILITDVVQSNAKNNWGKNKSYNGEKSIADMTKKELNKMTKKELLKKVPNELMKELYWELGEDAFSTMSKHGFENRYLELQPQNPSPTPYEQNMNHLPIHHKNFRKSKNTPYEILIQSLSLKK